MNAEPIRASIARVTPKVAARLDYDYVAICEHCRHAVVRSDAPGRGAWVHRGSGLVECP